MPHYKTPEDKLYYLDEDAVETHSHVLPEGSIHISDKEAKEIRLADEKKSLESATAEKVIDPVEKLKNFLAENIDVKELLGM